MPIYNVEDYLQQCVNSILSQTYSNLDIILVDDGSTDGSGIIADAFDDPRIRVFHTSNYGLSAARNFGIGQARGDYISFVDSDDWLESDIIEQAIRNIGDADIICFAYNNKKYRSQTYYSGIEALEAFIHDEIPGTAWSMLCQRKCYTDIRYPEGHIYEDTATTYKLFLQAKKVVCLNKCGYHYRYRNNSLTHNINLQNLVDYWLAQKDIYFNCKDIISASAETLLLRACAKGIFRAWVWKNEITKAIDPVFFEMKQFAKDQFTGCIRRNFPRNIRIGLLFAKSCCPFSFWLANNIFKIKHFFNDVKNKKPASNPCN